MGVSLTIPHGFEGEYDEYYLFSQGLNYGLYFEQLDGGFYTPYQGSFAGPTNMNSVISTINNTIYYNLLFTGTTTYRNAIVGYSYKEQIRTGFEGYQNTPVIRTNVYKSASIGSGGWYHSNKFLTFNFQEIIGNWTLADYNNDPVANPIPQLYWPDFDNPSSITNIPRP